MMMNAYDRTYLAGVMENLGAMMDYGINTLGQTPGGMFSHFISSGIAGYIEAAHPRYLAGLSGIELACMATGREYAGGRVGIGPEYWAGWALAYLQWESGLEFWQIAQRGLDFQRIISMYNPYHEADITKFAADAKSILKESVQDSRLKAIRKAAGLTQMELAARSGVSLRAIRSYEQNAREIGKAQVSVLSGLSRVLHCPMEQLVQQGQSPLHAMMASISS